MNFGIKNIESKIESLLKQNNLDTKVHFQYSSYNNFDIQCNAFLQIKKIEVLESIKQDIIDDLQKFKLKEFSNLDHPAKPRWPLDKDAIFLKGAGVKL